MRNALTLILLALVISGCTLGPDYRRPPVDTPQTWRFAEEQAADLVDTSWWEQFHDPILNRLIASALTNNKDLKIATARLEEYRARYGLARAALFPQVGAAASAGRQRSTEIGPVPLPATVDNPVNLYQGSIFASWEIDLWGRLRRGTEAANADLLSTGEARRAVILSLVTSVASAYVNLRNLDRQLEISNETAMARAESFRIFSLRYKEGFVSELELSQAKSLYEGAQATVRVYMKAIALQENALSVILGLNPGAVERGKPLEQLSLPIVPAGLPSDLLTRRPDIRQAEQNLISANAQIGIARAQYFPSISLTGMFGWESTSLSQLFTGPARTWSWAVPLTQPIFTGGSTAAQVKVTEAFRDEAVLQYQKVIQNAFRDVEDSLADQQQTREQLDAQARQVESLRTYARVARLRYDNGYTSYIEVLDAERSLFDAELAYSQSQGGLFQALINLYKAMAGGWVVTAEKMSAVPE
jgi:outer membrane protein, multidrug efflux system